MKEFKIMKVKEKEADKFEKFCLARYSDEPISYSSVVRILKEKEVYSPTKKGLKIEKAGKLLQKKIRVFHEDQFIQEFRLNEKTYKPRIGIV